MIKLDSISVHFATGTPLSVCAINRLSLTVGRGEFISVIGSNGAGKSTLLSCLAGNILVSSGRVTIDNIDVTKKPTEQRAALVARVFQDPLAGTCGTLTIEENLALADSRGCRRGFSLALNKNSRARFQLELRKLGLGLENRMGERVESLSGGQRQALSLLLATMRKARVFLLDEHTAALDPRMSSFVMDLTERLVRERGLTTIMVTHSLTQALRYGERLVMLDSGRVIFESSGEERKRLSIEDLVARFSSARGSFALDSDELLLS